MQIIDAPDSTLSDVLAYMEANFDKSVRLAELAEMSALSVSRFATVFRQRIGLSPYKYLCRVRVRRAQLLLLAGVPGAVVAAEVGFLIKATWHVISSAFAASRPPNSCSRRERATRWQPAARASLVDESMSEARG